MRTGEQTGPAHDAWFVEPDPGVASQPRRNSRHRASEERASSARAVIASSLFLVVLATALLVGGHAAIDPLLQSAIAARDAKGIGSIVYTMPDGIYCRHMSFDNTTAELAESSVERCPEGIAPERVRSGRSFAWGR